MLSARASWPSTLFLLAAALVGFSVGCRSAPEASAYEIPLALDAEVVIQGTVLTAATQSVNRYHSVLRQLDKADVHLDERGNVSVRVYAAGVSGDLRLEDIDVRYVVPLLPYPHERRLDDFDGVNLMLAEYARNGIALSVQAPDSHESPFGGFRAGAELFNEDEIYGFEDGRIVPNAGALPKRVSLTNNCLTPGLWELAASDTAGEMHHAWFDVPKSVVYEMVRAANQIDATDEELERVLAYRPTPGQVPLDLERLRERGKTLVSAPTRVNPDKDLGGYSTQDSRRKVQRGFYRVERDGQPLEISKLAEMREGDVFKLHSFEAPGIYTREPRIVPFDSDWTSAEIADVVPRTSYGGAPGLRSSMGYVEITLHSSAGDRVLVVGNVPVDLLVFQEDYSIPAFGAGVLDPSQPIERRYLQFEEGPPPHYAYLAAVDEGTRHVLNNHETGLEQIFLRPVRREGGVGLRVTLVAYERIVDLLELDIPLDGELSDRIRQASANYHPPLYRSYLDSNTR